MEVQGIIKVIGETQTLGAKGFRKRECAVTTDEQYPQIIMTEFVQDKVDLLDAFKVGDAVTIHINLRGREWTNPEGKIVYFNTIQGWRIVAADAPMMKKPAPAGSQAEQEPDDLPF